jgi:predicted nucleic acid-binding protein
VSAILDTGVLISNWRPDPTEIHAISVATIAELHFGVLRTMGMDHQAARLARLAVVESEFDPIPVDAAIARSYAECAITVQRTGRNPRSRVWDLIVAATAITTGSRLYTLNPEDFHGLEDRLDIVTPDIGSAS